MATGHYIQRKMGAAGAELHTAGDPNRDQSYFLFSTTGEQLDYLRFPLGHLKSKAETRALASKYGLFLIPKPRLNCSSPKKACHRAKPVCSTPPTAHACWAAVGSGAARDRQTRGSALS